MKKKLDYIKIILKQAMKVIARKVVVAFSLIFYSYLLNTRTIFTKAKNEVVNICFLWKLLKLNSIAVTSQYVQQIKVGCELQRDALPLLCQANSHPLFQINNIFY